MSEYFYEIRRLPNEADVPPMLRGRYCYRTAHEYAWVVNFWTRVATWGDLEQQFGLLHLTPVRVAQVRYAIDLSRSEEATMKTLIDAAEQMFDTVRQIEAGLAGSVFLDGKRTVDFLSLDELLTAGGASKRDHFRLLKDLTPLWQDLVQASEKLRVLEDQYFEP